VGYLVIILIFLGGIVELCIIPKNLVDPETGTELKILGSFLIIFTFLRAYNILILVFITVCIGFSICMPCCPCKKYFEIEVDTNFIDKIEKSFWSFNQELMNGKTTSCNICLGELK